MSEGLIAGISAYCDRWCERCTLWHRCRLGIDERRAGGSRPWDPDEFLEEITRYLQEALELATKECERLGIDPQAALEEEVPDTSDHPLLVRALEWCERTRRWLAASERAAHRAPPPSGDPRSDCLEVVSWYHTLVPTKLGRALSSRALFDGEGHEDGPLATPSDADGSAKVAWLGLVRVIDSLTRSHGTLAGDTGTLEVLLGAHQLTEEIDREFPGHRSFRRPGFDEPE